MGSYELNVVHSSVTSAESLVGDLITELNACKEKNMNLHNELLQIWKGESELEFRNITSTIDALFGETLLELTNIKANLHTTTEHFAKDDDTVNREVLSQV